MNSQTNNVSFKTAYINSINLRKTGKAKFMLNASIITGDKKKTFLPYNLYVNAKHVKEILLNEIIEHINDSKKIIKIRIGIANEKQSPKKPSIYNGNLIYIAKAWINNNLVFEQKAG